MQKALWLSQVILLYLLTFLVALTPLKLAMKMGSFLGVVVFKLWKSRRRIAIENVRQALDRGAISDERAPEGIIRNNFINLGKSFIEITKVYYGLGQGIIEGVEIRGKEHFEKAKERGKGIFLFSGHCGNWELLGLTISYKICNTYLVARHINNPYINNIIERARKKFGNYLIYKRGALKSIISQLRKSKVVGMFTDQSVLPDEGMIVDFLGRPAWTMKTLAIIARKTGASLLPVFIRRAGKSHILEFSPEVELSKSEDFKEALVEDMKSFTSYVEEYVRKNPAEWLWIHRRWKRTECKNKKGTVLFIL